MIDRSLAIACVLFAVSSTCLAAPALADETPVLIASGALPGTHRDVLINLAAEPPADARGFGRICEIVGADEAAKRQARVRWRGYRDAGLTPESHNL